MFYYKLLIWKKHLRLFGILVKGKRFRFLGWGRFRIRAIRVVSFRTYLLFFGLKWGEKFPKNGKNSTKILNLRQGMTDGWVSKVYQSK